MKQLFSFLLIILLLAGCASPQTPAPEQEAPTKNESQSDTTAFLGSFEAQTLAGDSLTEAYFSQADLTVINVWATFCGPCKNEMPILAQLDQELEQVQLLGIVTDVVDQTGAPDDDQITLAQELADLAGCEYPNLVLNQSLATLGFAGLSAVPATLFVDRDGNLVGQGFYGALDEAGWRSAIAERLELAVS